MHKETRECRFLGLASKPRSTIFPALASKPVASGFLIWISKLTATVWSFGSQNHHNGFLVWSSKPSRLRFVSSVIKLIEDKDSVGHASRSSGLLR
jgi:hypothetical protein